MHADVNVLESEFHHDRATILFHWASVVLILAVWTLGLCIDFFPSGAPRVDARSAHFTLGFALALLLIFRFHWRHSSKASHSPPEASRWHQQLRDAGHSLLYALAALVILLGIVNAFIRGDSIFGLVSLPALTSHSNTHVRAISETTHLIAAHVLVGMSGLHGLVALARHYFGDGGITRMLPARE